jgi:hypothetical protein
MSSDAAASKSDITRVGARCALRDLKAFASSYRDGSE